MRQLLKRLWPSARTDVEDIVGWAIAKSFPRYALNASYNFLTYEQKSMFYRRFAKLFRNRALPGISARWEIKFLGRRIVIPLREESMWLDWDTALSILGHEPEIKATYETLMRRVGFPRRVFDVGANYGIHSLLFMVHGIDVIAFEPNPACHWYYDRLERHNDVKYRLEPLALGSRECKLELCYPEKDSWLGTTHPDRMRELPPEAELQRIQVSCITLDSYVRHSNLIPDLIKLDAEGSEYEILLGAADTLGAFRPLVIFECWKNRTREQIWRLLEDMGYVMARLPLLSPTGISPIAKSAFMECPDANFAALPKEMHPA